MKSEKTILIATNNLSKFNVIRPLLKSVGLDDCRFIQPADAGIVIDVDEQGSLENRARQKAVAAYEAIEQLVDPPSIFMYVGADDGIHIDNENKTFAASKEATDRILQADGIQPGDGITIVRAFAFLTPRDNKIETCVARVALTFLGNDNNVQRQEGIYPLEYVLAYKGLSLPVSELDETTRNGIDQKYMQPVVASLLESFLVDSE